MTPKTSVQKKAEIAESKADMRILAHNLKRLRDNNLRYIDINQQLQNPSTRSTWLEIFKHRAKLIASMYNENNVLNDQGYYMCMKHYAADIQDYRDDLTLRDLYRLARTNFTFYYFTKIGHIIYRDRKHPPIPFIMKEALANYEPDMERLMPHSELTFVIYATQMRIHYQISQLGDPSAAREVIEYGYKCLQFEDHFSTFSDDVLRLLCVRTYRYLLDVKMLNLGAITPDEIIAVWERYKRFSERNSIYLGASNVIQSMHEAFFYIENFPSTYAIMYHRKHPEDTIHHEWVCQELNRYVDHYQPSPESFQYYTCAMRYLGRWNANQACVQIAEYYDIKKWKLPKHPTASDIVTIIDVAHYGLTMLADSDFPAEYKELGLQDGLRVVFKQIKLCAYMHLDAELSFYISRLLDNPSITNCLTQKERLRFFKNLYRATLVQTYAHSRMVSRLSEVILDGIIRYQPELLVGYFGIKRTKDVEDKAYLLSDYIMGAAWLHDVGKLTMIQIVGNDHCRLEDHEFKIIKQHPERGIRFLHLDPSFDKFHDVVLGHHKWYNGQGGYPAEFDNTKSPYRLFIDIMSIADSLEAATDNLGRNYSKKKAFPELFGEMHAQAGTRYNPEVMDLIKHHRDVYQALAELVHSGWEYNYYEVYLDYFDER